MERNIVKAITFSNWCAACYPTMEPATFIHNGWSLCESHLREHKEEERKEALPNR